MARWWERLWGWNKPEPYVSPRQQVCRHEQAGDLIVVDQEGTLTEPLRIIVRCRFCGASFGFSRQPTKTEG